jgi:hypothetical protein
VFPRFGPYPFVGVPIDRTDRIVNWHFFTKLVFAAPERGLPSLETAASSQHFFMKLAFAAPARYSVLRHVGCFPDSVK